MSYQSPIALHRCDTIPLAQCLEIHGHNHGALFNEENKLFVLQDRIVLAIGNKKYRLEEYHFHVPGEHEVNNQIYQSEIHYVFHEINEHGQCPHFDACCGNIPEGINVVVIGRVITDTEQVGDLSKIQIKVPDTYFEYDGSLTTSPFDPIRWIVGIRPIGSSIAEITPIAKPARELQPLNNRIIQYHEC